MITVRSEKVDDKPEIQLVRDSATATLRQTYRPKQIAIESKAHMSICFHRIVAELNGRVVGTLQYYVKDRSVQVTGLGVHVDYRQKGVASNLMHYLEKFCLKIKATQLKLYTVKETGNVDVFRRLGFTVIAERNDNLFESDRYDELTEVEMMRKLS